MDLEQDLHVELTPKIYLTLSTHMVIKILDGSSCKKKCIISTSAIYIWHKHE